MSRNRLYLLIGTATLAGYAWLVHAWYKDPHEGFTPCIIKNATGIACPSCGTTRSVLEAAKGNFTEALLVNPLGLLMGLLMVILPLWIVRDLLFKKRSLHGYYGKFENIVRIKWVAIFLSALIILNWIWNVQKGL